MVNRHLHLHLRLPSETSQPHEGVLRQGSPHSDLSNNLSFQSLDNYRLNSPTSDHNEPQVRSRAPSSPPSPPQPFQRHRHRVTSISSRTATSPVAHSHHRFPHARPLARSHLTRGYISPYSGSITRSPLIESIDPMDEEHQNPHLINAILAQPTRPASFVSTSAQTMFTESQRGGSVLNRATTTYTTTPNTSKPRANNILNLSQRVLTWLYSISLIIIIIIMLAFIAVTPIDVIVQTLKATNAIAVKTFLVIIVCVAFLFFSLVMYLGRVYSFRVAMNDVSSKSLYIPFEGDYPKDVFHYIDLKLKHSVDVGRKAGPLHQNYPLNHSGLSPPEYIQNRNPGLEGKLLPPNISYEDVLQSLSDKFQIGKVFTVDDLPVNLSVKEMLLSIYKQILEIEDPGHVTKNMPNIPKLIATYEKCRFGGKLIEEKDMFTLMVEIDKYGQLCQHDFQLKLPQKRRMIRSSQSSNTYDAGEGGYLSSNDLRFFSSAVFDDLNDYAAQYDQYGYDYDEYDDDDDEDEEDTSTTGDCYQPQQVTDIAQLKPFTFKPHYHASKDDQDRSGQLQHQQQQQQKLEEEYEQLYRPLRRQSSISSSKSVIRNKLALNHNASRHTLLHLTYDGGDGLGDTHSLFRHRSGYVTDSENEDDFDDDGADGDTRYAPVPRIRVHGRDEEDVHDGTNGDDGNGDKQEEEEDDDDDDDDDDESFYRFRRRNIHQSRPITPDRSPNR